MSTTAEKIAALEDALGKGVLEVRYDGQSVRYQSVADIKSALAYFREKQAREAGRPSVVASIGAYHRT